jgi:hypothetical protein
LPDEAETEPTLSRAPSAEVVISTRAAFSALQLEGAALQQQAALAAQRKDLAQRAEAIMTKLSAAKASRDIALIASIRREEAVLEQERRTLTLSEEECCALPDKIRDLEDRLLDFALECDVDTLDRVAELQLSVRQALDALVTPTLSPVASEGKDRPMCSFCEYALTTTIIILQERNRRVYNRIAAVSTSPGAFLSPT